MTININKLKEIIKIKFKNKKLLVQAITHKSYDSKINYEKLEFLGDRVLGLTISMKLLELYPNEKVGILDKKLASLVNKDMCYSIGKSLKLDKFILTGNSAHKKSKIENKIVSDSCESLLGAIYLDKNFTVVNKFILSKWKNYIQQSNVTIIDSKTQLQEYSLKKFKSLPIYKLISNTGPRHKPNFIVGVKLKNTNFFTSTGSSKKNAEQSAATRLLKSLNL